MIELLGGANHVFVVEAETSGRDSSAPDRSFRERPRRLFTPRWIRRRGSGSVPTARFRGRGLRHLRRRRHGRHRRQVHRARRRRTSGRIASTPRPASDSGTDALLVVLLGRLRRRSSQGCRSPAPPRRRRGQEFVIFGPDRWAICHVLEDRPERASGAPRRPSWPRCSGIQQEDARRVVGLGRLRQRGVGSIPDRGRRDHGAGPRADPSRFPSSAESRRWAPVAHSCPRRPGKTPMLRVEIGPAAPGQVPRIVDHHEGRGRSAGRRR